MRIVHVIVSLYDGGAQAVLYSLLTHNDRNEHCVISLTAEGKYSEKIEKLGIPVHHVGMPLGKLSARGILQLYRLLKSTDADTVQTWMYHSDLLGGLVARMLGIRNVVWGIHHTTLDKTGTSRSTRLVVQVLSKLSGYVPKKIISCSRKAVSVHEEAGYESSKLVFVGNGYDLERFQPSVGSISSLSLPQGVGIGCTVFATVARWNPQKDQKNLIDACRIYREMNDEPFVCLLIGPNVDASNEELSDHIKSSGLSEYVYLCGSTSDVPAVMNAIDFHVLPSAFGEAFPNVVAEAMACGTPCLVTDVGDAAEMVGDTGWVVPPKDPYALAKAIDEAVQRKSDKDLWIERKTLCRHRALDNFDIAKMVRGYEAVWEE